MVNKNKFKLLALIIVLASIAGSVMWIVSWAGQDNEAVIYEPRQGVANTSESNLQTLTTPYFSLQLPTGDEPQWRTKKDAVKVQVLIPNKKQGSSYALQSDIMQGSGLSTLGDVSMRQKDPENYEPKSLEYAPKGTLAFWQAGDGSIEKAMVAYIPFNGRYLSVAVTSQTYSYYEFEQDIKLIIQSLKVN